MLVTSLAVALSLAVSFIQKYHAQVNAFLYNNVYAAAALNMDGAIAQNWTRINAAALGFAWYTFGTTASYYTSLGVSDSVCSYPYYQSLATSSLSTAVSALVVTAAQSPFTACLSSHYSAYYSRINASVYANFFPPSLVSVCSSQLGMVLSSTMTLSNVTKAISAAFAQSKSEQLAALSLALNSSLATTETIQPGSYLGITALLLSFVVLALVCISVSAKQRPTR
ncbi:hypothetical protein HDU91_002920 [Kappamyces sp. JEL0680]|nr:hypothetical protein HDU91_002920 [Kappamyces sp. JEL0680]